MKRERKIPIVSLSMAVFVPTTLLLILLLPIFQWSLRVEASAHYIPEYEKLNIEPILQKETLSEEDYEILFWQTGMAGAGVDTLRERGEQELLVDLQERFFAEVEISCTHNTLISRSERLTASSELSCNFLADCDFGEQQETSRVFLPAAEPGDVLVTFSGHVLGWRSGHAGIVVDGERRLTLEAITLGCDSRVCSLERWSQYPCFALLRLKEATPEKRKEIADYALEHFDGVPYSLTVFCTEAENEMPAASAATHCSHLVWAVYRHFGYDLDSDGGYIVTPRDLYDSDQLELIQLYGLKPEGKT